MYSDSTDILNKLTYKLIDYRYKYRNKKATRALLLMKIAYH